jgi:hypothetical protein
MGLQQLSVEREREREEWKRERKNKEGLEFWRYSSEVEDCLACTKPCISSPALERGKKEEKREGGRKVKEGKGRERKGKKGRGGRGRKGRKKEGRTSTYSIYKN